MTVHSGALMRELPVDADCCGKRVVDCSEVNVNYLADSKPPDRGEFHGPADIFWLCQQYRPG